VLGPRWTQADRVTLYLNGIPLLEAEISPRDDTRASGIQWEGRWSLPRPKHDVHLAVVATGPGIRALFWPTPKPYQPTSPDWHPKVLGCSGAVFIDADGSGKFESAFEYATRAAEKSGGDLSKLLDTLAASDEAVAIQAASVLRARGADLLADSVTNSLRDVAPHVRRGFDMYVAYWKQSVAA